MFTRLYVEAILKYEVLADAVWERWDAGVLPNEVAALAWWILAA